MKDSCSTGNTVWELDGKTIIKYDLSAEPPTIQKWEFKNDMIALSWFADIAIPVAVGHPEEVIDLNESLTED